MRRGALLAALLVAVPLSALAQSTLTTAELEALATADAEQYGVPVQLFLDQIQAESGFNPDATNPSGAEGIAQFLPSTAADPGYGIAPFNPTDPTAALAAAAQYNAALYAANGDNWVAALTAYSGGLTPTNPASYGTAFADAEAADAGTVTAGGDGLTVSTSDTAGTATSTTAGSGTIASAAAANGITGSAVSGSSFNPFTYLWTQYSSAIAQPLASELAAVQTMIEGPLLALLSLSVMLMALGAYTGRFLMPDFFNRLLRISAVVALTSVGSTYYNEYVVQFFGGLPTWFSNNILGAVSNNPAAGFDIVFHTIMGQVSNVWYNLPWGVSTLFVDGPIIAICFLIVFFATALMFTVWLIAQALLQLLIVLGPLIVLGILFDHTRGWFDRWLSAMTLMVFVTLAADLITSIVLKVIVGAMNTLPLTGTGTQATQDVFNLVGITLVVFVLSSTVAILPAVLQHIAAASGTPAMNHARQWLGGATSAVTRGAGRTAGAAARGAVQAPAQLAARPSAARSSSSGADTG
jgi:type IV secretory pathway VirB6-like protein